MKIFTKSLILAAAIAATGLVSACATPHPLGILYTKITLPAALGANELQYSKVGEAKCFSLMGLIASGDASINAACQPNGITKVSWVSYTVNNFFGIYGTYTTTVYGD